MLTGLPSVLAETLSVEVRSSCGGWLIEIGMPWWLERTAMPSVRVKKRTSKAASLEAFWVYTSSVAVEVGLGEGRADLQSSAPLSVMEPWYRPPVRV